MKSTVKDLHLEAQICKIINSSFRLQGGRGSLSAERFWKIALSAERWQQNGSERWALIFTDFSDFFSILRKIFQVDF